MLDRWKGKRIHKIASRIQPEFIESESTLPAHGPESESEPAENESVEILVHIFVVLTQHGQYQNNSHLGFWLCDR